MDNNKIQDSYKSIAAEAKGLFKDNGSRFIAHAYPVETEEEVKEIVAALKKEYYDARHHVYAYRLGYLGDKFRANDDGEPSGSSGRPVLGQIDSNELSDILVICVFTDRNECAGQSAYIRGSHYAAFFNCVVEHCQSICRGCLICSDQSGNS